MIESIRTYRLEHQLEEPFAFSQWEYAIRRQLLVELVDASGAVGWGECYGPATVTQSAIESFYAPLLIGWDALRNEAAWQHCWRASLDFSRKGVMMGLNVQSNVSQHIANLARFRPHCHRVIEHLGGESQLARFLGRVDGDVEEFAHRFT